MTATLQYQWPAGTRFFPNEGDACRAALQLDQHGLVVLASLRKGEWGLIELPSGMTVVAELQLTARRLGEVFHGLNAVIASCHTDEHRPVICIAGRGDCAGCQALAESLNRLAAHGALSDALQLLLSCDSRAELNAALDIILLSALVVAMGR